MKLCDFAVDEKSEKLRVQKSTLFKMNRCQLGWHYIKKAMTENTVRIEKYWAGLF